MKKVNLRNSAAVALAFGFRLMLMLGLSAIGAIGAMAAPGDILLVSRNDAGVPGDYGSDGPSVTPDGRYVAFESVATNLVTPAPPVTISEIYRRDLETGQTVLVSSSASGEAGDDNSYDAQISSDGRYVAFFSYALNLVTPAPPASVRQVYRKDLQTGEIVLVSASTSGEMGNDWSHFPSISSDGNFVAFMSVATNLVLPPPPPGYLQIYRKNVDTGAIVIASENAGGTVGDSGSSFPSISSSGRYVVFNSDSTNLISPSPPAGISQVYRKDFQTGEVVLASSKSSGQAGDDNSYSAHVSPDGRFVAFNSEATNFVSPAPPAGIRQCYRKDLDSDDIDLATSSASGQPANDGCDEPALSPDGRYVCFQSFATNLISPAPPAGFSQAYRKDVETGGITLASSDSSGTAGNDTSSGCSASSDGRYVFFNSGATNLVSPAPPAVPQIYRKELFTPEYVVLSSGDYDGDGKAEIAVFRPWNGLWAVRGLGRMYFGTTGDIPVSGDYNGDGYADVSVFRPSSGLWAVKGITRLYFGGSDDTPVPADYDGDGCCDIAVMGKTNSRWAVRNVTSIYFGTSGDRPVPADYEGSGTASIAVFRPSTGLWRVQGITRCYFGSAGDVPVPGNFTWYGSSSKSGPFRSQIAVFRSSTGLWAIRGDTRFYFGSGGDRPVIGGFNGNSLDNTAIFRPDNRLWAIRGISRIYFGTYGDIPVTR